MTIAISGSLTADGKTRRYVEKIIGSLARYMQRARPYDEAIVVLDRVDRDHGNLYDVTVTLKGGSGDITATDSTLNVLAALDIVRLKLVRELQKERADSLPPRKNRV